MSRFRAVDLFAGGGGASEGILRAMGVGPRVAINHSAEAIKMHATNHPGTMHLCESVFDVDPFRPDGKELDLLWLSPDCTHFSRAKGGKPRSQAIRGLAWSAVLWASSVRPRVICLENVPEFLTWGPLDKDGQPDKSKRGETFFKFCVDLEELGYQIEWKTLVAADYGAPTTRKRLFLIARCDGAPIVWPTPTHGPGRRHPYRTAAECIDFSLPCPSIFMDAAEAKQYGRDTGVRCKRPLAEKTLARIAEGVRRYVVESKDPFIFTLDHQSSSAGSTVRSVKQGLSTITTKARHCLVAPSLIQTGYGERKGQRPRCLNIRAPLGTVVAGGSKHAVVSAFLAKHYTGVIGQKLKKPIGTVTAKDHHSLVVAHMQSTHSRPTYRTPGAPLPTVTASFGGHQSMVATHLTKFYGTSKHGASIGGPMPTVTASSGGGHMGLVYAFLMKYYGTGGQLQDIGSPMHTIVSKARFGLITVMVNGEEYAITDIGMRMLQPRELARAQGFQDSYKLTGTKTQKIARIGNSVPPPVVEAIVRAQFRPPQSAAPYSQRRSA